jgi:hypothetical protein
MKTFPAKLWSNKRIKWDRFIFCRCSRIWGQSLWKINNLKFRNVPRPLDIRKNWKQTGGIIFTTSVRSNKRYKLQERWDHCTLNEFVFCYILFVYKRNLGPNLHRWALSPISVISDIGLSLKSDWKSGVWHNIAYWNTVLYDIRYPISHIQHPNLNRQAQ